VPQSQCTVTFTDTEGMRHSVDVSAESPFEAAALALKTFRASTAVPPVGPATELEVTVRQPETRHGLKVSRLQVWLSSSSRSPKEQALKFKLKQILE
jgi:hypothetical protein